MSETERRESFFFKPVGQRAAIVAAGPIANFLLAIVIFAAVFTFYGKQATPARVDTVQPGSAARGGGLQVRRPDRLDQRPQDRDLHRHAAPRQHARRRAARHRRRTAASNAFRLKATPKLTEMKDNFGNVHRIGVLGITGRTRAAGAGRSAHRRQARRRGNLVRGRAHPVLSSGASWSGRESADQLGGPIRIAQVSGQVATAGFVALIHLAAVLSISIGLLNLFPIPLLDGGHLLFYAIEAVRGRPLSDRARNTGSASVWLWCSC